MKLWIILSGKEDLMSEKKAHDSEFDDILAEQKKLRVKEKIKNVYEMFGVPKEIWM